MKPGNYPIKGNLILSIQRMNVLLNLMLAQGHL